MAPSPPEPTPIGNENDGLEDLMAPGTPVPPPMAPEEIELTKAESDLFVTAVEIGSKTGTPLVCGKRILMKTANTDAELAIGMLIKPWVGTDAYNRAYKTALVAACVIEVDGAPLAPLPTSDADLSVIMERKFEAAKKYYPFFIDALYEAIIAMEQDLKPLLEKLYSLGKGSS